MDFETFEKAQKIIHNKRKLEEQKSKVTAILDKLANRSERLAQSQLVTKVFIHDRNLELADQFIEDMLHDVYNQIMSEIKKLESELEKL